jgi:hypothetical protein
MSYTDEFGNPIPKPLDVIVGNTIQIESDLVQGLTDTELRATPISSISYAEQDDAYYPEDGLVTGDVSLRVDASGSLRTRSAVLTDEISFRDDFSGNTLSTDWQSTGSVSISSGFVTLALGTGNGTTTSIVREGDYCPFGFRSVLSVSQRIANQSIYIGLINRSAGVIQAGAYFLLTGTNNKKIACVTQSGADAGDTQTTSGITLPAGLLTSQLLYWKIDTSNNQAAFQVSADGKNYDTVAIHVLHIPSPYQLLDVEISGTNSAVVTNTNIACDLVFTSNQNRIQIDNDFTNEPVPSQIYGAFGYGYKDLVTNETGALKVELSGNNVSAFGDAEVVPRTPLIQGDFVYGLNNQLITSSTANGGTADTNAGRARLQTGTNVAGSAVIQSVKTAKYRAGQGVVARWTAVYTTGVASSQQEWGAGNSTDGYLFGYVGTQFGAIYRNGGVQTFIPQVDWLIDPCDGTGHSGFTLDPTKGNVYQVKYPYLGYGDIKFYILRPGSEQFMLVHVIQYANTSAATQLSNPNLSFYGSVTNSGNNTNLISYSGSYGFFLSGVREFLGPIYGTSNFKTAITTETNLLTIRNATTYNGVPNRSLIKLKSISFVGDSGNGIGILRVLKNATLGGVPVFNPVSGSTANNGVTITSGNSVASVDTAGTTITGGSVQFNTVVARNSSAFLDVTDLDIFIEPGSTMTFAATGQVSINFGQAVNWVEDI